MDPIAIDAHNPGPMTGNGNNTFLITGDNATATLIDAGQGHPEHLAGIDRALTNTGTRSLSTQDAASAPMPIVRASAASRAKPAS